MLNHTLKKNSCYINPQKALVIYSFLLVISILSACTQIYTPKPTGFIRIEPPVARYMHFNEVELPYTFNISQYSIIELPPTDSAVHWINIDYPDYDAIIYCSYKQIVPQTLNEHIEECIKLSERVARNASAITERSYENEKDNVYASLFFIEGETASPVQFMLTDSISHFFRGALYYKYKCNADSIAPVTNYLINDITEIIQTFHWKK